MASAPIARLKVAETWFDKGGNIVGGRRRHAGQAARGGRGRHDHDQTPLNAKMNSNSWNFSHANGTVKPKTRQQARRFGEGRRGAGSRRSSYGILSNLTSRHARALSARPRCGTASSGPARRRVRRRPRFTILNDEGGPVDPRTDDFHREAGRRPASHEHRHDDFLPEVHGRPRALARRAARQRLPTRPPSAPSPDAPSSILAVRPLSIERMGAGV